MKKALHIMAPDITPLRIGTRGSPLALTQANIALKLLRDKFPHDFAIQNAVLIPMMTTGDRITDRPLFDIGGKGFFAKELQQALIDQSIDCAVHSLKDLEVTTLPELTLAATLKREDARDVLVSRKGYTFKTLPAKSIIGTCAPRRVAQILYHRPDLICIPLRGNVDSRLQKLQNGEMDAIILALAGLRRLGRETEATYIFPASEMIPAVGQGVITLECRKNDSRTITYLNSLNDPLTERCVTAERSLLAALQGSCQTPIGGYATLQEDGQIKLDAFIASLTGTPLYQTSQIGNDPLLLGQIAAEQLKKLGGLKFWNSLCVS